MSIIRANKIREKITQRRGVELLAKLDGLDSCRLGMADAHDISWQENIMKKNLAFDSKPNFLLPIEDAVQKIIEEFENFIDKFGNELLVLFEIPFILELSVRNPEALIQSFYRVKGTRDITVFSKCKKAIFEVQELEYEVKIFSAVYEN
ncbi:hypothetical protein VLK31_21335 [Variovorax sp. H27-G14]|uniref:hypothetical protein n=1 Tax=Variovorax sp. H27-G14 TaxID=3111914 RepID=UPI0038FC72B9